MSNDIHPNLEQMIPLVEGIAKTIGKHCEVVLHDFTKLPDSIIAIANGHVTGRGVGSPQTEHSLSVIKKKKNFENLINYSAKTFDGKLLKSSSFFVKDENNKAIGVLCINLDVTAITAASRVLEDMTFIEKEAKEEQASYPSHVNNILNKIVAETVDKAVSPVAYLSKEDKVDIVKKLDEQGAFLIKGAIDYVAEVLCVSRYTVYNYLVEVRGEEEQ